jgi:hypothetical protein
MPETRKKTRTVSNPKFKQKRPPIPKPVQTLAEQYGLDLDSLLDWKVYSSGKVVLIAPNGMKFVVEDVLPEVEVDQKTLIKGKKHPEPAQVKDEC